jgi:WD40 repeat protein
LTPPWDARAAQVACGFESGMVQVLDPEKGVIVGELPTPQESQAVCVLSGYSHPGSGAARVVAGWSGGGLRVLTDPEAAGGGSHGQVALVGPEGRTCHLACITSRADPPVPYVLAARAANVVAVLDGETGEHLATMTDPDEERITRICALMAYHEGDTAVAAVGSDCKPGPRLRTYDVASGAPLRAFVEHSSTVCALLAYISPGPGGEGEGEARLVSASKDRTVRVWAPANTEGQGPLLATLPERSDDYSFPTCLAVVEAGGRWLLATGGFMGRVNMIDLGPAPMRGGEGMRGAHKRG